MVAGTIEEFSIFLGPVRRVTTRELIEAAFAQVPYPGDDNIADHQNCPECDDVRAFFRGRSWRELLIDELYGPPAAINLFSAEALRYFLPGFMLASLEHWKEADLIPDWILYSWLPPEAGETEAKRHRIERQSIFSPIQKAAIAAYLREYAAYDQYGHENDIPRAIEQLMKE